MRFAASEIAKSLDRHLKSYVRTLFWGLFLALVFFHVYAHLFVVEDRHSTHEPIWLGLFLLVLLVMAGLVSVVWYDRLDDRRLDYRALAEALRVRYFWALAGLTKSVAGNYLGHLEGEMSWARRSLYAVAPPPPRWKTIFDSRPDADQIACLEAVAECWVSGQRRYYHREHRRAHRRSVVLRLIGLFLALSGWGLSVWLVLGSWMFHLGPEARHPEHLILIVSSLLVIGGGLMIAYCERRNFDALARQYGSMQTVFERGERELAALLKAGNWDEAREVIGALGNEALVEHVHWLVLHRVHPFEMIIEG